MIPDFLTEPPTGVAPATGGTRIPADPLKVCATGALVALLLAFVLAVHDRGGTTYDNCPILDDPTTCQEALR